MQSNLIDFTDKTVLVTGGSSGIGRATALAFAKHGANVAIGDMNETAAQETTDLIKSQGGKSLFLKTNVAQSSDVKALIEKTIQSFGGLDCAFNNAGVFHPPLMINELDEATFDRVISVDLKGVFLCLKYELQHMRKTGRGAIVNTASIAGLQPEAGAAAYVAAKHGVIGLTKTAAIENAHLGIRVNALAPGWVRTPMTKEWEENQEFNEKLRAAAPMHRGAEPEEMTGMVLYLCSDAASYVSGQTFVVDGAQTIRGLLPIEVEEPAQAQRRNDARQFQPTPPTH
ncbi:MAG: glucose 1-dehydrogenase [Bdellovibrionaceae bacterium]|nr:glucose 1-dehydrogenase [Pseudobdellovibrionaceae bacterium]